MSAHDFRAIHLPYCLKRLPSGKHVVLNRNYKPLGFDTREHLEYEAYPIEVKIRGLTKRKAAELSWNGKDDLEMIWLYNDTCVPTQSAPKMKAYLERLEKLAKLEIETS